MLKVLHFYKTYTPTLNGGTEQVIFSCVKECLLTVLSLQYWPSVPRDNHERMPLGQHHTAYNVVNFELAFKNVLL
ncbi:MAG: hypothetical protein HNEKOMLI_00259 [Sodalis sp. Psp]|nr:hypothetical protein [Sodalis sp. Psp]MCR3756756.1 hypothetical protein [Sodalis sp. Ppy]